MKKNPCYMFLVTSLCLLAAREAGAANCVSATLDEPAVGALSMASNPYGRPIATCWGKLQDMVKVRNTFWESDEGQNLSRQPLYGLFEQARDEHVKWPCFRCEEEVFAQYRPVCLETGAALDEAWSDLTHTPEWIAAMQSDGLQATLQAWQTFSACMDALHRPQG